MLNKRSKSLLAKLPKELREFKLAAEQHRDKFRIAVKSLTETYTLFGRHVKKLFLWKTLLYESEFYICCPLWARMGFFKN